jgi:hypothetical protein
MQKRVTLGRLLLVFALLSVAADPAQARSGGGHGSHGGHARHGNHHHHVHHLGAFPFLAAPLFPVFPQFPFGYPCWWEEGHWKNQVYGDKFGNYTTSLSGPQDSGCAPVLTHNAGLRITITQHISGSES